MMENTEAENVIWGVNYIWWALMAVAVIVVFVFVKIKRKL
jgi:type IV secretory pathway component VirB8